MSSERDAKGPESEGDREALLDARIKAAREKEAERTQPKAAATDEKYRLGNKVLAELLGGMGGGALVGWVIDHFAGTSPWGLLVMLFLGTVVAFRNIIRIASPRAGADQNGSDAHGDTED